MAQQRPSSEHPDPALLQALAERILPPKERSSVMDHLADCSNCRDVISLLTKASEAEVAPGPAKRVFFIFWTNRRWAAAILASVCLLLVFRPGRNTHTEAPKRLSTEPSPETAKMPVQLPAAPVEVKTEKQAKISIRPSIVHAHVEASKSLPRAPSLAREWTADPNSNAELALLTRSTGFALEKAPAPASATAAQSFQQLQLEQQSVGRDRVEWNVFNLKSKPISRLSAIPSSPKTSFAPQVEAMRPNLFNSGAVSARPSFSVVPPAVHTSTSWSLSSPNDSSDSAPGTLHESRDGGKTWTAVQVDRSTRFFALATQGLDIWAGGDGATLFHSPDDGVHWANISVAEGDQHPTGTITRIDTHGERNLVLKLDSGESWTTTDNGLHWMRTGMTR